MINAAETIPPVTKVKINAAETLPPYSSGATDRHIQLVAGESISDSYVVHSALKSSGKQADIYIAKKWGKSYVVKLYNNGWHPSAQMQTFLSNIRHPNIAHVIDSGDLHGNYFEIYEYYSEGTLADVGALAPSHIQDVVVPSINEGLHELHRNGIVHCDIKPSNLFYSKNRETVIIGDCGISDFVNANGKLIDNLRGTPEYAPRVRSLLWSAAMSPAYDYGSFGLVLCRLVLGHSLFEGMSVEEISRAWENGIELPSQISGRLLTLIKGLISENEEARWGYTQVKRWCEGEYMRPTNRNIYARRKEAEKKPLIYGRFNNEIVSVNSVHQLSLAIRENWEQATKVIRRRELVDFIAQFDREKVETIRVLAQSKDLDAAVFKLLTIIDDNESICFKGKTYSDLSEFVDCLATGKDETAIQFMESGLFVFYLREKGFDPSQVDKLEQLIRRTGCADMGAITTICFALQGKRNISVFGYEVENLDELVTAIAGRTPEDLSLLLENEQFIAWMNRLGYEKEMRFIRSLGGEK